MTTAIQDEARGAVSSERLYGDVEWFSHVRRDTGGPGEDLAADYIAAQLAAAGVPVTAHEFDAFLSYPVSARLEALAPEAAEIRCVTHSFALSTGPEGLVTDLIHLGDGDDADALELERAEGKAALIDGLATPVTVLRASQAGCAAIIFANKGHAIHNMICHHHLGHARAGSARPAAPVARHLYRQGGRRTAEATAGPGRGAQDQAHDPGGHRLAQKHPARSPHSRDRGSRSALFWWAATPAAGT